MHNKSVARSMPGWLLLAVCFLALGAALWPACQMGRTDEYSSSSITVQAAPVVPSEGTVPVNLADAALLQTLPGIGPATAQAILEERERNGPFAYPEDLMHVKGIGEAALERIRPYLDMRVEE